MADCGIGYADLVALTDNLVSYWKLDETSGNAADSVGSNTLTNNGTTPYAPGIINNGADFNGTDQYLSIADASQSGLDITGDMSISAWVRFNALGASDFSTIVGKWLRTADYSWRLLVRTDRVLFQATPDGSSVSSAVFLDTLTTATWYHVVLVYDNAGTVDCYINDTAKTQVGSFTTSLYNSAAPFTMGKQDTAPDAEYWTDGIIDEVGVWNRTLTSAEVTELYNGGAGNQYPFSGGGASNSNFFTLF